jgi:hypothetical protein
LAIASYKNSKQNYVAFNYYYVLMKAVGKSVFWKNDKYEIDLSYQTKIQGVSALMIQEQDTWYCEQAVFLVENRTLFDDLSWLSTDFNGTVVYYGGNLNTILLNWFAFSNRTSKLYFFPDYDAVGLNNYLKLSKIHICEFYFMPHWQEKLRLFANTEIWHNNIILFDNTVADLINVGKLTTELSELIRQTRLIGACLEQEAIYLTLPQ